MTQMESPKRKMQKKNDYQRHKLFRKIKRRRKAQAEAEQHMAEKQLRKKLKLPKFGDGKEKVNLDNAHFDKDGNLVDNTTGAKYTATTNDVIITPNTKYFYDPYSSANNYFDPNTTFDFINATTAPISNFAPSNIIGSLRRSHNYASFMNAFMNQDNNGLFADNFSKAHPTISNIGNIGVDILTGAIGSGLRSGLSSRFSNLRNQRLLNKALMNMSTISDDELDKIYQRIYNSGEYDDLQKLRDKHFEIKANNPLMDKDKPKQLYHTVGDSYDHTFNAFDPTIEGQNTAIYTTDNLPMSMSYSFDRSTSRVKKLYSNSKNASYNIEGYYQPWNQIPYNGHIYSTRTLENAVRTHPQYNIDRLIIDNIKDWGGKAMPKHTFLLDQGIRPAGTVVENFSPSDLKYSSAVTFDDYGNVIPLSKRDNFNINDLRYAVIPTITGGYAVRSNYDSGKDINIKKSKRGTFTKAAKQHGMSVQSFANRVLRNPSKYSAAMRKKANFAHNAASWKH